MSEKSKDRFSFFALCFCAILIPGLLFFNAMNAKKFSRLKRQVQDLEKKQSELIEENRKLITEISVLSSSDRIEKIAQEKLGMHRAQSDEIVRLEIVADE